MIAADLSLDVRRVAWRFYTWRLQCGTVVTVGQGGKASARRAVVRFVNENLGQPGARKVLL